MRRNSRMYFEDILDSASKIIQYVEGFSLDEFRRDQKTIDAVVRNLEIIGEAAKKISEAQRKQYSHVEWKKIAGLRDMLIHEYFGVDIEIIWDIVHSKIPLLIEQISNLIDEVKGGEHGS